MRNIGPIGHPQHNPVHRAAEMAREHNPPVDRCPECQKQGCDVRVKEDFRVLVGGRGIYRCPVCETCWQDEAEGPKSAGKDTVIRPHRHQCSQP